jgi:hypothetical protein
MSSQAPTNNTPLWSRCACYLLILLSFTSHAFTLDRYPAPYWDEAIYCSPAINYVEGRSLKANFSAHAPHPEINYAFTAPFFPRLEVITFYLLGTSQFSSRILPYAAAHAGIALLCQSLLRLGLYRCAICLAVTWIGDCSMTWFVWARPEGLGFFCLAGGFASILRSMHTGTFCSFFMAGLFLAGAIGVHPVTILFACVTGVIFLLTRKRRDILAYLCGILIIATAWVLCWMPNPVASMEQLRWHLVATLGSSRVLAWLQALSRLGWSRYWVICLIMLTLLLGIALISASRMRSSGQPQNIGYWVGVWAVLFAGCALIDFVLVAGTKLLLYYFAYFTIWPVIGLVSLWEGGFFARVSVRWKFVTVGLLACSWLPSMAWNARRIVVPIRDFAKLDRTNWETALAESIPEGAQVTGSTEFFILTRRCRFSFLPIPLYSEAIIPSDNWVLLEDYDYREGRRIDRKALADRTIALKGQVCPQARGADRLEFVLLGPAGWGQPVDRDERHAR